jgi:hypothetical protein
LVLARHLRAELLPDNAAAEAPVEPAVLGEPDVDDFDEAFGDRSIAEMGVDDLVELAFGDK